MKNAKQDRPLRALWLWLLLPFAAAAAYGIVRCGGQLSDWLQVAVKMVVMPG